MKRKQDKVANHYFGKRCRKHPEANGKRYYSNRRCVPCMCSRWGKYKAGAYSRLAPERREKQKQFAAKWSRENPTRRKLIMVTHHLKVKAKGSESATGEQLRALWRVQRGRCALTGVPLTFRKAHLDHIRPTSKGGTQTLENLRWTHPMANRAKGTDADAAFWHWIDQVIANYRRVKRGQ